MMDDDMSLSPSGAGNFARNWPAVWDRYTELGRAVSEAGDLSARERRLVKLALAFGAGSEGAVHSHTRQAREEGVAIRDLQQIGLLAITTLGFPAAMAELSWVNDIVEPKPEKE